MTQLPRLAPSLTGRFCVGCAGKSLADNLADCPDLTEGQKVIVPLETPIKDSGHIQILYGNLAPQVCCEPGGGHAAA